MLRHPERESREAYLRALDPGAAGIVSHIIRCDQCAVEALEVLVPPEQRRGLLALRRDLIPIDYSHVWARVEETSRQAMELLRQERAEAEPLLRELLRLPQEKRLERVRRQRRFRTWALADALLEEGRERPTEREALARVVLAIAEAGLEPHADRIVGDLVAAAWCDVAETFRACGELGAAAAAFDEAAPHLLESVDLWERAKYHHLLAALRRDQGKPDEAIALLARAANLLEEHGNQNARAVTLIELGFLALERGEPKGALEALDDATSLGRSLSADLAEKAVEGTVLALVAEGRFDDAFSTLAAARNLYGWPTDSPEGARLLALEERLETARVGLARSRRRRRKRPDGVLTSG